MQIKKKILKNFLIQKFLGFITAIYIYFVKITSSINYENEIIPEKFWKNNQSFILAFWHSQLMMIVDSSHLHADQVTWERRKLSPSKCRENTLSVQGHEIAEQELLPL